MNAAALHAHIADYLRLRRALGFKLDRPGHELPQFARWLQAQGIETITVDAAIAWARLPEHALPIYKSQRLGAVRGFARYLRTIDPATEIPPIGLFGKQQRHTPYIYTAGEIARLLHAAGQLRPPLRAATFEALFGLLGACGMRIGEATRLLRDDVDLAEGIITIRHAKFDRDRLLPLHPSTTEALGRYATRRDQLCPTPHSATFFLTKIGTALRHSSVHATFLTLADSAGLPTDTQPKPHIHSLRHTFAVNTVIGWQREGIDIASRLPLLSTYLGHVNPASTYWYLTAVPELMQLAAARLERPTGEPGTRL